MKKISIVLILLAFGLVVVSAASINATVLELAGKVEYQAPGKGWVPAKVGTVLPKGTIVSTGFKSTAILKVGTSTVTVKPITRLSLEEILESDSGTQTQLFLLAGRVKADVTPQAGKSIDFKVKSPTATASVRGTGFEFDGINLFVEKGSVQFMTPSGMRRFIGQGEFSRLSPDGTVSSPVAVSGSGLDTVDSTGGDDDGSGGDNPPPAPFDLPIKPEGILTIIIS